MRLGRGRNSVSIDADADADVLAASRILWLVRPTVEESIGRLQKLYPMYSSRSHPGNVNGRYSAKNVVKPINFVCVAPEAKHVSLVGDFNDWHAEAHPMKRQPDGAWMVQVPLNHGHHHYLFLVDGKHRLDPAAQGVARNERNEKVSLIAIS